jgi:hypothetical protein
LPLNIAEFTLARGRLRRKKLEEASQRLEALEKRFATLAAPKTDAAPLENQSQAQRSADLPTRVTVGVISIPPIESGNTQEDKLQQDSVEDKPQQLDSLNAKLHDLKDAATVEEKQQRLQDLKTKLRDLEDEQARLDGASVAEKLQRLDALKTKLRDLEDEQARLDTASVAGEDSGACQSVPQSTREWLGDLKPESEHLSVQSVPQSSREWLGDLKPESEHPSVTLASALQSLANIPQVEDITWSEEITE